MPPRGGSPRGGVGNCACRTDDLQALVDAGAAFSDARLLSAEIAATGSTQLPQARIGALASALTFVDSGVAVSMSQLLGSGNPNPVAVALRYVVAGESESFTVPGRAPGALYGEAFFTARTCGLTEILHGPTRVTYVLPLHGCGVC